MYDQYLSVCSVIDQEQLSMEIPDFFIGPTGNMVASSGDKTRNSDIVGKYARHSEVSATYSKKIIIVKVEKKK